ncbi:MAG TPA: ion channel [Candidatus Cybelea sp.]|nr:ion channel [Candidatus Cybelea sp.]
MTPRTPIDQSSDDPTTAGAPPRLIGGTRNIQRIGEPAGWRDLYHWLMVITWPRFLGLMAAGYIGANVVFAGLYSLDLDGIANTHRGSFADAFFFSVQTIATIGYGVMYPQTLYVNLVVTLETLFGMMSIALAAGIIFARFSRPTARVLFSSVAVIAPHDGVPTLMFRAANRRRNQILAAEVAVAVVRNEVAAEGQIMRRFHDLALVRDRNPVFALTWTVMHQILPGSPLHGRSVEELYEAQIEIVVTVSGIDETFAQTIYARHSYITEDLRWNARFADILGRAPDGRRTVDYRQFHEIVPIGGPP